MLIELTSDFENKEQELGTQPNLENKCQIKDEKQIEGRPTHSKISSDTTVLRATLMLTNICLGTSIFAFSTYTKSFGLVWMIFFCIIVALISYWSLRNCIIASSKFDVDDYSEITEKILGRKARIILNIFIIAFSYGVLIAIFILIFSLTGRFIHAVKSNDNITYDNFAEEKWQKAYVKYPFMLGIALILSFINLIKDITKLHFSSYISVSSVIYCLFVIVIECNKYYQHYKTEIFDEYNESSHINYIDLRKAFTNKLIFFKGFSNLVLAFNSHVGVFPVFAGLKYQKEGIKKMKLSIFFSLLILIALYLISMICSYLTDPLSPEELVIYRKPISNGNDIPMSIAKLLMAINLIFIIPGLFCGLRLSFANAFTKGNITSLFNIIYTFSSMLISALIAASYDKILSYLSYLGGFISVFICYLFPTLLIIYTSEKPFAYWKNLLNLILTIILCIIGIIGGIRTIIDDVS